MNKGKILNRKKDLSIPWFEQIEKTILFPYNNKQQVYYSIKPPDYVTALTCTTENQFVILKQYRPVVENFTFELPSGHREEGETPAQAMIREVKEETGSLAESATLLGEIIPDTGRLENRLWAFYVSYVEINRIPDPLENEGIEVSLVTQEELLQMIREGKLNHALDLSVIALAIFQRYLKI
jgi:8-oxo-dGTP pyrophosphatase MutT (NUDIX family)